MVLISITPRLRFLFLLMVFFNTIQTQAQIENISLSKEINIDRIYAGLLTSTQLSNHNSAYSNFSSIQFGTRVQLLLIPELLKIRSFGVFKSTEQLDATFIRNYEAILTPFKNTSIHFGVMATPTTELRPNPTTWQSQVETNSEGSILGGKPGAKIKYNFNKDFSITYGLHDQKRNTAHHIKASYKQVSFASYIEKGSLFTALRWGNEKGNLLVTLFKRQISISSIIPISKHFKLYVDMAYDDAIPKLTYGEFGLRRYFPETHLIKGFLTLSYNNELEIFQGGLFIHI